MLLQSSASGGDPITIRIMTFNAAMLPNLYGMGKSSTRASQIASILRGFDCDVVCLQELFVSSARNIIVKEVSSKFPYTLEDSRRGAYLLGVNSGLTILSAFPIVDTCYVDYSSKKGVDIFAKKGMAGVRIAHPSGKYFNVFTTHLQAGGKSFLDHFSGKAGKIPSDEIKIMQLKEAAEEIQNFLMGKSTLEASFFTGDFNINSTPPEEVFERVPHILSQAVEKPMTDSCDPGSAIQTSIRNGDKMIDFIFKSHEVEGICSPLELFGGASDHLCLFGIYRIG